MYARRKLSVNKWYPQFYISAISINRTITSYPCPNPLDLSYWAHPHRHADSLNTYDILLHANIQIFVSNRMRCLFDKCWQIGFQDLERNNDSDVYIRVDLLDKFSALKNCRGGHSLSRSHLRPLSSFLLIRQFCTNYHNLQHIMRK